MTRERGRSSSLSSERKREKERGEERDNRRVSSLLLVMTGGMLAVCGGRRHSETLEIPAILSQRTAASGGT